MAESPLEGAAEQVATDSSRVLSSDGGGRPRLRLHHLFAVTAVMAVLLAIQGPRRGIANPEFTSLRLSPVVWVVWGVAYQLIEAIAITAIAYGLVGQRRGVPFFTQPGHWLLLENCIATMMGVPISLLFRSTDIFSPQVRLGSWQMTLMLIFSLYSFLVLGLGRIFLNMYLARKCKEPPWKQVFYAKAVAVVLMGIADILVVVLAYIATRADRREHRQRDASHWGGVFVQLSASGLTIVNVALGVLNFVLAR